MCDCNLIILTPQDSIDTEDFDGLRSLQEGVDGYIEVLCMKDYNINGKTVYTVMYCDEEYRQKHDGENVKINAYATFLSETPVYGNIVIANVEGSEENGFTDIQTDLFIKWLNSLFSENKYKIDSIHKNGDTVIHW